MRRYTEFWWWKEEITALIQEKQCLFKLLKGPRKCRKWCRCGKTGRHKMCRRRRKARSMDQVQPGHGKQEFYRGRGAAKGAIFEAKKAERMNFGEDLDGEDRKENVFRLATQLMSKNRDAVSVSFVKDDDGKVVVEGDRLIEVWRVHYDKISNKELA